MTIEQFKSILNKNNLNRVDKSLYVYILRGNIFNFPNYKIASLLNETKGSISKMYGQAKTRIKEKDAIYTLAVNYILSEIKRLDFDKEVRISRLKEANYLINSNKRESCSKTS